MGDFSLKVNPANKKKAQTNNAKAGKDWP